MLRLEEFGGRTAGLHFGWREAEKFKDDGEAEEVGLNKFLHVLLAQLNTSK